MFPGCGLSGEYCYASHQKSGFLSNSNAHNTMVVLIWNINIAFLFIGLVTLVESKMHGDYFCPNEEIKKIKMKLLKQSGNCFYV